jgi:hypothetical protein
MFCQFMDLWIRVTHDRLPRQEAKLITKHRLAQLYQGALELRPDDAQCLHNLGLTYSKSGEWRCVWLPYIQYNASPPTRGRMREWIANDVHKANLWWAAVSSHVVCHMIGGLTKLCHVASTAVANVLEQETIGKLNARFLIAARRSRRSRSRWIWIPACRWSR